MRKADFLRNQTSAIRATEGERIVGFNSITLAAAFHKM